MPSLRLPDLTIVAVDTVAPDLLRMAIEDSLEQVEPADVIVWSDTKPAVGRHIAIRKMSSLIDYTRHLWYGVPREVRTSHFLVIQWDSWVINAERWSDEFLRYDYIGAVWPWFDHSRVGNGGFSLRSMRLARFVAAQPERFPPDPDEDHILCRRHRYALDRDGEFLWAPESVAQQFAYECAAPPPSGTFGFHDARNWPSVLGPKRLHQRLGAANDYVRQKAQFKQLSTTVQDTATP